MKCSNSYFNDCRGYKFLTERGQNVNYQHFSSYKIAVKSKIRVDGKTICSKLTKIRIV